MLNFDKHINLNYSYDIFNRTLLEEEPFMKGIPFAFFTTPKLNLSEDNIQRDNFLIFLKYNNPELLYALTTKDIISSSLGSPFIKILTNSFKGLNGKDINTRTLDIGTTFYGYKQTLPGPTIDSKIGDTVNIKFYEYKFLPIIKLHKAWNDYCEYVRRGWFSTSKQAYEKNFIDYVCSIYYFLLDRDCETILYWCRYTGATPISIPYSNLIAEHGQGPEIPEISIDYSYSYKDDLDPGILMDFNKVASMNQQELAYSSEPAQKSYINFKEVAGDTSYNYTDKTEFKSVKVCKSFLKSRSPLSPRTTYKLIFE